MIYVNILKNNKLMLVFRLIPFVVCIVFIIAYISTGHEFTVEAILSYTPDTPVLAALILLLMYAAKSISIVFPILVLNVAGGCLFSTPAAIAVNVLGTAICISVSYVLGRLAGLDSVMNMTQKYKKFDTFMKWQQDNSFFVSFFLRIINSLPFDVVSMYLGAVKTPFFIYLAASLAGALPGVIAATIIGTSITDPSSPEFIFSVILTVALSIISVSVYYIYKRKSIKNK